MSRDVKKVCHTWLSIGCEFPKFQLPIKIRRGPSPSSLLSLSSFLSLSSLPPSLFESTEERADRLGAREIEGVREGERSAMRGEDESGGLLRACACAFG